MGVGTGWVVVRRGGLHYLLVNMRAKILRYR